MRLQCAELPDKLVRAHRDGRLVLFVGAGASVAAPSCLPLFGELADRIVNETGARVANDSGAAEERLDELAEQGFNVHGMVQQIISGSAEPNGTHETVAALATAGQALRIVTTNYDRHLSACLPDTTRVYEAPDLPGDDDFIGVVHLHGSITQSPDRLVVTKGDFGRAYMQRHSPTLLFLHRLLASHTVLFIGYSLGDTLMQYILHAVEDSADLYILTPDPDSPRWQQLGVIPVGYPSHDHLPALLGEWAQRAGATVGEHDRRVAHILSDRNAPGGLTPQDESYLSEVVSESELVHTFTDHARGPAWLRWVGTRPETRLFTPSAELGPAEKDLAMWLVWHHNDDEPTAAEALRLLTENRGRLHELLWLNMIMAPNPRGRGEPRGRQQTAADSGRRRTRRTQPLRVVPVGAL